MRTLRASEIAAYVFCRRSWWYALRGEIPSNQADLSSGTDWHYQHGRQVLAANLLRLAAYALLLIGLTVIVVYLTGLLV